MGNNRRSIDDCRPEEWTNASRAARLAAARDVAQAAMAESRNRKKPAGGKGSRWIVDVPDDATHIGTAKIRSSLSTAQRLIADKTGNLPGIDHAFDEIAEGVGNRPAMTPAYRIPGSDRARAPVAVIAVGGAVVEVESPADDVERPRRNKHRAQKATIDGVTFDSAKEARRWQQLQAEQASGLITGLRRQVPFVLAPSVDLGEKRKKPALRYFADAVYVRGGARVVEDTKSEHTRTLDAYRIKKHLMMSVHGILISEF